MSEINHILLETADIKELRRLAKEYGINSFGKSALQLRQEILPRQGVPNPKKGKSTWKPAAHLEAVQKQDGYRYRWCSKDPDNIQRKRLEGWEVADDTTDPVVGHDAPGYVDDGKPLTTVREHRELVLMRTTEENARAREEWVREQTMNQTAGLKRDAQKMMADGAGGTPAEVHGNITIID